MDYFNFTEFDDRVFIPVNRPQKKTKEKSCFVDHNRVSKIKNAESLEKYIALSSEKKAE